MIPNKTEQQILYQNFKFFDLEGAGFCNLKDFIRTNEKIGVVLSHMQDFQDIFNYFDTDHCGVINYKQFCKIIWSILHKTKCYSLSFLRIAIIMISRGNKYSCKFRNNLCNVQKG